MEKERQISKAVIKRLPRYRRYLGELKRRGIEKVSSKDLSELIGYTASQIRQDLNNFGGFGQQGYGYSVDYLYDEISAILGLDRKYKIVMVGYGRLGQAMTSYIARNEKNFQIVGIFDVKKRIENVELDNVVISTCGTLSEFIRTQHVDIAVICVPPEKAQRVAETAAKAGVKGIWNFTAVELDISDDVIVEDVHMSDSLHSLAYYMNEA